MADNVQLNSGSGGQIIRALDDGTTVFPVGVTAFATSVGTPDAVSIVTPNTGLPVRLADGSGYLATLPVSLASVPSHAVTNAGTFAVQAAQTGTWVVDLGATDNAVLDAIAASVAGTLVVGDGGSSLTVDGTVTANAGSGTFAVSAASLPLPTGAATAANQAAGNTSLATLAGAVSGTEVQVDVLTMPTVTISDGGGAITVDGTVAVTGTFWQATQPVSVASTLTVTGTGGTFPVTDSGGSLTVDNGGTFAVQAAQSGTWNITNVSGTVSLPTGAATAAKQPALGTAGTASSDVLTVQGIASMTPLLVNGSGVTQPVSGTVTAELSATDNAVLDAIAASLAGTLTVTGGGGGTEYTEGATDASITGSAILWEDTGDTLRAVSAAKPLPIGDAGGSLTVDGTVAATQSGTWTVQPGNTANTTAWLVTGAGGTFPVTDSGGSLTVDAPVGTPVFVRLSDGSSAISTLPVSLASVPSHAVTNAGTFATQVDGAALTALQLIDNPVVVDDAAFTPATTSVMMAGFTFDNVTPDSVNEGDAGAARMSANRCIFVNIRDNAGNERGLNIDASGQLAVTLASAQTLATVTTVSTVTAVSTLTGGGIAHDSADSGNPHKIGGKAKSSLSAITLVSADDRTDLFADVDGVLLVRQDAPLADNLSGVASITDGSSTSVIAAQGSGVKTYITDVTISNTSATAVTVDLRDGTAGSVKWTFPVPANTAGVVHSFRRPLGFSANTAVAADPSASASTITVSLGGFRSKV